MDLARQLIELVEGWTHRFGAGFWRSDSNVSGVFFVKTYHFFDAKSNLPQNFKNFGCLDSPIKGPWIFLHI